MSMFLSLDEPNSLQHDTAWLRLHGLMEADEVNS